VLKFIAVRVVGREGMNSRVRVSYLGSGVLISTVMLCLIMRFLLIIKRMGGRTGFGGIHKVFGTER